MNEQEKREYIGEVRRVGYLREKATGRFEHFETDEQRRQHEREVKEAREQGAPF